jgi:hypothetical protein
MVWSEVTLDESGTATVVLNGRSLTVAIDGGAPARLGDGWRPRGCYAGFAPFFLVELCSDVGEFGLWILDDEARLRCTEAGLDPRHVPAELAEAVKAHCRVVATRLITAQDALVDAAVGDFLRLSTATRRHLFAVLPHDFSAELDPRFVDLATSDETSWTISTPQGPVELSKDRVMRVLHHYVHERFLDACRDRKLTWPMLTAEGFCEEVRCLTFRYDIGVLRCVDRDTGLLYYVVVFGANWISAAVFVPSERLLFTYSTGAQSIFLIRARAAPHELVYLLARHLCGAPSAFLGWLTQPPARIGVFTWPESVAHLGHFLWNECSGLDLLVDRLAPEDYPIIFHLPALKGAEFYGPLADLYPELAANIVNTLQDIDELQHFAYANGIQVFRISGDHVSAAIRNRVMRAVQADTSVRMLGQLSGPSLDDAIPTIILGLRLSDRTHVDLAGFYCEVIDHLLQCVPALTVVIDGLNARSGAAANSTFRIAPSTRRTPDLLGEERALVARVSTHVAGRPVTVVDCVGTGMRLNLFWIDRAQIFVAPWGGGMVKYRWVCNKPGVVFSSRANLSQPHHLPIYHVTQFMEDPAEIEYVSPDAVTDLHPLGTELDAEGRDAAQRQGGLSPVNFTLDSVRVIEQIAAMFLRTLPDVARRV